MAHSPRNRVGGIPIYPDMQGKVALVTGGSSGIGLATAGAFARQGVKVVIASRREATAKTALKQLSTLGDVQWLSVDAADGKSAARLMDSIMNTHGHLDYAFNNGGSGGGLAPVAKMREEVWRKTIDGYLTSTEASPRCARAASGHVATAPPSVAMNCRRRRQILICPSHAGELYEAVNFSHRKQDTYPIRLKL